MSMTQSALRSRLARLEQQKDAHGPGLAERMRILRLLLETRTPAEVKQAERDDLALAMAALSEPDIPSHAPGGLAQRMRRQRAHCLSGQELLGKTRVAEAIRAAMETQDEPRQG